MIRLHNDRRGFTIVELMIATSVFSVVLLICAYGLLEIGRTYYRGVTTTRTQETARRILDDVTESIKFNGGNITRNEAGGVHCLGNKRYSFVINRQYVDADPDNHALVSDDFSCGLGSPTSQNLSGGALTPTSVELLNTRMRVSRFSIDQVTGPDGSPVEGLYRVTVRVVTGEDDLLVDSDGTPGPDTPVRCKSERAGSQFCAVSELTTTVQKRI